MDNKMLIIYVYDYTYFSNTVAFYLSGFLTLKFRNSSIEIDELVKNKKKSEL